MKNFTWATFIVAMTLTANVCFAEWKILEVRTTPFSRDSYNGPPEMHMHLLIQNASERTIFVWGQDWGSNHKYYSIESFIQNKNDAVWERQNSWMCDATGKIGLIEVKPGESVRSDRILYREYAGRQMLLTFRRAYNTGDTQGSEVLVGPFNIPQPKESEPAAPASESQPSR